MKNAIKPHKRRILICPPWSSSNQIVLDHKEAHYLGKVLRLNPGDHIEVFDGQGRSCSAVIEGDVRNLSLSLVGPVQQHSKPAHQPILIQGVCKSSTMDLVIQKATELGVGQIFPFLGDHASHTANKQLVNRLDHWQKVANSAAMQSQTYFSPEIAAPCKLTEVIASLQLTDLSVAWFDLENAQPFKPSPSQTNVMIIGPEGGFSAQERDFLMENFGAPATLGPLVLRAETATIAALAISQYIRG